MSVRWRCAELLDRVPGTCWPSLVEWALHRRALRDCRADWMCLRDGDDRCYCGKYDATTVRRMTGANASREKAPDG